MKRGQMVSMRQDKFSLEKALKLSEKIEPFYVALGSGLKEAITDL